MPVNHMFIFSSTRCTSPYFTYCLLALWLAGIGTEDEPLMDTPDGNCCIVSLSLGQDSVLVQRHSQTLWRFEGARANQLSFPSRQVGESLPRNMHAHDSAMTFQEYLTFMTIPSAALHLKVLIQYLWGRPTSAKDQERTFQLKPNGDQVWLWSRCWRALDFVSVS